MSLTTIAKGCAIYIVTVVAFGTGHSLISTLQTTQPLPQNQQISFNMPLR